jgi:uncharacterized membrane protein YebE (DUF533 family)
MTGNAMKYIIGAILGMMLGAGIEYERGGHEIHTSYAQLGAAYGCGDLAGKKYAIKTLNPAAEQMPEISICSDYRMLWEAVK